MTNSDTVALDDIVRFIGQLENEAAGGPLLDQMAYCLCPDLDREEAPSTMYAEPALSRLVRRWGWVHIGGVMARGRPGHGDEALVSVVHRGTPDFICATPALGLCALDLYDYACDRFGRQAVLRKLSMLDGDEPAPADPGAPVAGGAVSDA